MNINNFIYILIVLLLSSCENPGYKTPKSTKIVIQIDIWGAPWYPSYSIEFSENSIAYLQKREKNSVNHKNIQLSRENWVIVSNLIDQINAGQLNNLNYESVRHDGVKIRVVHNEFDAQYGPFSQIKNMPRPFLPLIDMLNSKLNARDQIY